MPGILVATANTETGRLLKEPDGLHTFTLSGVDVLLLQEVFGLEEAVVADTLLQNDYRLIAFDRPTGLAIALHKRSLLKPLPNSEQTKILQGRARIAKIMTRYIAIPEHHIRPRGVLAVDLLTEAGQKITFLTTHPTVFIRREARLSHLHSLQYHLINNYDRMQPLIVGADMNHYPRPGRYDVIFRQQNQLHEVPVRQKTWSIEGTKYERLATIVARMTRRPLNDFDGQLDTILYRGKNITHLETTIVAIKSDHRAVVSRFSIG